MDKQAIWSSIETQIEREIEALLPHGAGPVTDRRLRRHLEHIAQAAFQAGQSYVMTNLMTAEAVALRLGVSVRRVRAIAAWWQKRGFPVGAKIGGTWLFLPEDIERMADRPAGGPRSDI